MDGKEKFSIFLQTSSIQKLLKYCFLSFPTYHRHMFYTTDFYRFLPRDITDRQSCFHKELPSFRNRTITPTGCLKFETLCVMPLEGVDLGWAGRPGAPVHPSLPLQLQVVWNLPWQMAARGGRFIFTAFTWDKRDSTFLHEEWCLISPFQLTPQCESQCENMLPGTPDRLLFT